MPKYIFVTGGVVSSLGKGIASASIGKLLECQGLKVTLAKFDPYLNVDPGTMNPYQHGEVFVTEDGIETDQDIGNYERFLNQDLYSDNYMTTGRVYEAVIHRERNLGYEGRCVQVVPHIPEEVIRRITKEGKSIPKEALKIEWEKYQDMIKRGEWRIIILESKIGKIRFLLSKKKSLISVNIKKKYFRKYLFTKI